MYNFEEMGKKSVLHGKTKILAAKGLPNYAMQAIVVKRIVHALNRYQADPVHLTDVIEDMLG